MMLRAIICVALVTQGAAAADLAEELAKLSPVVGSEMQRTEWKARAGQERSRRIREANDRSSAQWRQIDNRQEWEAFRDQHVKALAASLGQPAEPPAKVEVRVTGTHQGDGFVVENIVFQSRPGWWVTANRYLPVRLPGEGMPGFLLCHAHHTPKEQSELQDMGMTWARAGCVVLVPDHLGHGERRQHPFRTAEDYEKSFRPSRQDYYFRYDNSLQLYLVGESLMGWMAWDLMRGVDVLLATPGIDKDKIILLGAVAGGGDPAAVTAALDPRIAVAAPFNFGGPQPETRYPLPEDAETSFNYAGGGSWESTRNIARSAADGFLPWVIVGGIAPRRLIFAHEFNWDQPRDPVWKRLQAIYGFYEQPERLAYTHGFGELRGQPPNASHCTHIGRPHRVRIHKALAEWFGIQVTEKDEYSKPLPKEDLLCLTPQAAAEIKPATLSQLTTRLAEERLAASTARRAKGQSLAEQLKDVLGVVEGLTLKAVSTVDDDLPACKVQRVVLEGDRGTVIPLLILSPREKPSNVVVAVAQQGKEAFLKQRSKELAALISRRTAVVLADLRGTGEISSDTSRGRSSGDTGRAATELMLGTNVVAQRVAELRGVLGFLSSGDLGKLPLALWGDSTAARNAAGSTRIVPHDAEGRPNQAEPMGPLVALLTALYEPKVKAVYAHGGLDQFTGVLASPQVLVPHDSIVPGLLTVADLPDIVAALAPRPVCLSGLVDGRNELIAAPAARTVYRRALDAYSKAGASTALQIDAVVPANSWLSDQLVLKETHTFKTVGKLAIKADVYRVAADAPRPVVVWIHGGALINGHREGLIPAVRTGVLERGYAFVSIDYRLAPETQLPEVVQDVVDAFTWIREQGPKLFQADPKRIAVIGGSAGGYLTLTTGHRVEPRPAALVSLWGYGDLVGPWYSTPSPHPRHHTVKLSREEAFKQVSGPPVSDSRDRKGDGGGFYQFCRQQGIWPKAVSGWDPHEQPEKFHPYMPLKNVTSQYPPTLLIHGQTDTDVPYEQSELMAAELKRHGVEHKLIGIPDAEHGLAGAPRNVIDEAYQSAVEFLAAHME